MTPLDKTIFIGGLRRSGTTFLQRLLSNHPQLNVYPHEECFVRDFVAPKRMFPLPDLTKIGGMPADEIFECLLKNPKLRLIFDPREVENPINRHVSSGNTYRFFDENKFKAAFVRRLSERDSRISGQDILSSWLWAYEELANGERPIVGAPKTWVLKCPDNGCITGCYRMLFPKCRIILMIRDPRTFSASEMSSAVFAGKSRLSLLKQSIRTWKLNASNMLEQQNLPNVFLLKFEDLVFNQEQSLKRICDFLEIKFEDSIWTAPENIKWEINSSYSREVETKFLLKKSLPFYEKALILFCLSWQMQQFQYSTGTFGRFCRFGRKFWF